MLPETALYDLHFTSPTPQGKASHQSLLSQPIPIDKTAAASSQLELILAKLSELDTIKSYLNTIDYRLNFIQLPSNPLRLVA